MENEEFFGELEKYKKAGELEAALKAEKDKLGRAKELASGRMLDMQGLAMDALQMALQSEDEGVRIKAVTLWLSKVVPNARAVVEDESVIDIPDSRKHLLDDVTAELKKKLGG